MRSKITTRAAAAAIAVTALMGIGVGLVLGQSAAFNDVPESDRRSGDIDHAAAQGWFRGYPDGSFRPDRRISEVQLARVIRRAHPGLTRGDAAVFLRGGIDRLRSLNITPTTTTTTAAATTTTTQPAAAATTTTTAGGPGAGETGAPGEGEPGGQGPGGSGPVDPNPPVVIETTTTTQPAQTTTTTQPAAATTTTTSAPGPQLPAGAGERNVYRYGYETGWVNSEGRRGSIFWAEKAISDYRFPDDASLSNWWSSSGSARFTITGRDSNGRSVTRTLATRGQPTTFYAFDIQRVTATCNHDCTLESSTSLNQHARSWAGQYGYSEAAAATTTTTTAAPTATTLPAGRTLLYGKESGWTNNRGVRGHVVWWVFRNWDSERKNSLLVTSYGGSLIVGAADEDYPYWFTSRGSDFSISQASCEVTCTAVESSTMPNSMRNRLKADGYTEPSG